MRRVVLWPASCSAAGWCVLKCRRANKCWTVSRWLDIKVAGFYHHCVQKAGGVRVSVLMSVWNWDFPAGGWHTRLNTTTSSSQYLQVPATGRLQLAHLSDLDVVRVLERGGQLLPGRGHSLAVTAPRGEELHKVGTCGWNPMENQWVHLTEVN